MEIIEYRTENNASVDLGTLTSPRMPLADYALAHRSLVILCHDAFIAHEGGILLIHRRNHPAKDILWPLGGRVDRGVPIEESLRRKVKRESNLDLINIRCLGVSRTFFSTEPFGHNRGTDTFNIVYFAEGVGKVNLDNDHEKPVVVYPERMSSTEYDQLHPYVREYLQKI
ncbi:MAG: NUDIX domain-containing protein [Cyclobacteriaceae bacterium]|nr:NUDIX domain-containing protein [Cyclobacteriaceae bacterium]